LTQEGLLARARFIAPNSRTAKAASLGLDKVGSWLRFRLETITPRSDEISVRQRGSRQRYWPLSCTSLLRQ